MRRRFAILVLLSTLVVGALLPAAAGAATSAPLPTSMAAVGDSITQAASTGGGLGTDYPANSWSTGTNSTVNSHYLRLLAVGADIGARAYNESVSGAKVADLNSQMQQVVALQPDYVTVLIGGNDLCTGTVDQMTSVDDFRSRFQTAMTTLTTGSPDSYVYVVSIPDVYQLWNLFKGNWWARTVWALGDICQSLLANPTSTQQADVQRRAAVRERNIAYNTVLAEICAGFASRCRFDGNASFNTQFARSDVSADYFHPSLAGQAKLASVSWTAGYTWTTGTPNQAPIASFASTCTDLACTFTDTSTDADGSVASRSWTFGDGSTSTAANPSHTYAGGGTYTVTLTVTDNAGASASTSAGVTVGASAATPMWVSGVAATTQGGRGSWSATVTVSVSDSAGGVAGVAVNGSWSTGGAAGCTTSGSGSCEFTTTFNKKTGTSVYTVTALAKAGWVYEPGSNTVASVSVTRP